MDRRSLLTLSSVSLFAASAVVRSSSATAPKLMPLYSIQVRVQRFAQKEFLGAISQYAERMKFAVLQEQLLGSEVLWNVDLFRLDVYIKITNFADRDLFDIYVYDSCFSFNSTATSPKEKADDLTSAIAAIEGVEIVRP